MMGDKPNQEKFGKLAEHIRTVIIDNFWKQPAKTNRQAHFATLLFYDILPPQEKKTAVDSLLRAVKEGINGHITAGIFGTKYILESLSQNGYADKVYEIVDSRVFPGWGFMIDKGATTVWETWKESDNVYSNCHPMFGTVTEWFYRWLGGIRINKDFPGFTKFTVGPNFPNGLNSVNCSYNTPNGRIVSQWQRNGGKVNLNIEIPRNCEADLVLPKGTIGKITLDNMDYKLSGGKLVPGIYKVEFMIGGR